MTSVGRGDALLAARPDTFETTMVVDATGAESRLSPGVAHVPTIAVLFDRLRFSCTPVAGASESFRAI
jgi:hypothetical protein